MSTHSGSGGALWGGHPAPRGGRDHVSPNRDKPVVQSTRATVVLGGLSARRSTARTLIVLRLLVCSFVVTSGRWRCIGCWRVPSGPPLVRSRGPRGARGRPACACRGKSPRPQRLVPPRLIACWRRGWCRLHRRGPPPPSRAAVAVSTCLCAGVSDGPGQRASFGEHVA